MAGVDAPRRRPAVARVHAPLLFSTPPPSHLRRRPVHVVFQQARPFLWRLAHLHLEVEGRRTLGSFLFFAWDVVAGGLRRALGVLPLRPAARSLRAANTPV